MKLSDYVLDFLKQKGVDTMFYLPGGGCMHLLNSATSDNDIQSVEMLHEQALAIATLSYSDTTCKTGVALVTTGPGATNTITGVLAAYVDSAPCFFLSGQVKTADLKSRFGVRAHGSQEADIVSMVASITKYAVMVTDKNSIRYHLERAWYMAHEGRKGPVWIDVPLDIQGAQIDKTTLKGFVPPVEHNEVNVSGIIALLNEAKRPVIIAGNGMASCRDEFEKLKKTLSIPVIPSWKAMDYVANDDPLYAGRVGGMGDRHGNLTMQNADLIISLGCRLDFSMTGFDRTKWAPKAKKIVVDIDKAELMKLQTDIELPIIANVVDIIRELLKQSDKIALNDLSMWHAKIAEWKEKYPIITTEKYTTDNGKLTTYGFIDTLCNLLPEDAFVAPCSAGTTAEIFFQAFTVKKGQTIRSNHGIGSMGFEIPNAIGMCIANGNRPTICVAGDGGMQLNIQELAGIAGRNLPIKLFVINNQGYASIRNMQNNHFAGHYAGCDESSGLFLPEVKRLANAYCIPYFRTDSLDNLKSSVYAALCESGPSICEVFVDVECIVTPRTATQVQPDGSMRSSLLENQFPFLSEEEVQGNMLN